MDVPDIRPQLARLDNELDDLEDVLKPLFSVGDTASQLPLLDQAKLYTMASYSIESLLFCRSPSLHFL
jgi:exosome complex protein LRP1